MLQLQASQVRAARALLGWKQEDLAEASDLSLTAIRSFETGYVPRNSTAQAVRHALENAGLEFTDGEGVRRRSDEIKIYKGANSCDQFFEDVVETLKKQSGDLLVLVKSQDMLLRTSGASRRNNLERLESFGEMANIKCLLAETLSPALFRSLLPCRVVPAYAIGPVSGIIYGNKYAHILPEGRLGFMIVAFDIAKAALDYSAHFLSLWDNASLMGTQGIRHGRCA
jgi:transcriptional regulator with XRE-family HTH domain